MALWLYCPDTWLRDGRQASYARVRHHLPATCQDSSRPARERSQEPARPLQRSSADDRGGARFADARRSAAYLRDREPAVRRVGFRRGLAGDREAVEASAGMAAWRERILGSLIDYIRAVANHFMREARG